MAAVRSTDDRASQAEAMTADMLADSCTVKHAAKFAAAEASTVEVGSTVAASTVEGAHTADTGKREFRRR
jgi:hypothetical protein